MGLSSVSFRRETSGKDDLQGVFVVKITAQYVFTNPMGV